MNATIRYWVIAAIVGLAAFCGSLSASLPGLDGGDWLAAVIAGTVALGGYLGIGYISPLEPNIGLNKSSTASMTILMVIIVVVLILFSMTFGSWWDGP